jgi:hypothetical protein
MSDFGKRYRMYQGIASLCVALFIVNMAFCLMCTDKYIFKTTYAGWIASDSDEAADGETGSESDGAVDNVTDYTDYTRLSQFQAELIFQELSDEFLTFFGGRPELTGYELNTDNARRLNTLKWSFRRSVFVVALSAICCIYCYIETLHRRRDLSPLLYGSVLAAFFVALRVFFIVLARHGVKAGIRAMILHRDYSYFSQGDILERILPPDYARFMGLVYLFWVVVLILVVLLVRRMIIFVGRPHRY